MELPILDNQAASKHQLFDVTEMTIQHWVFKHDPRHLAIHLRRPHFYHTRKGYAVIHSLSQWKTITQLPLHFEG